MKTQRNLVALALAGVLVSGCMDLEVLHPNAPDRERALSNVNDIEQLVAGGYRNWYNVGTANTSTGPILATMAYQHAATAANYGMVDFSYPGSSRVHHMTADPFYDLMVGNNWIWFYRAVSAVTEGLATLEELGETLEPGGASVGDRQARIQAYGYFVLGLAHGSAALLYDQAYIYDPSISVEDVQLAPYTDVFAASMSYFDRAIAEATGKTFTIPMEWMADEVSAQRLIQLAYSYKARFRAAVARTPTERAAVDWNAVIADVDRGITETFYWNQRVGEGWTNTSAFNMFRYGPWGQVPYHIYGMADQSGQYQRWIARDPWDRHPNLNDAQDGDEFLIITPDLRFPRGNTILEQCGRDLPAGRTSCLPGSPAAPLKPADTRGRYIELTADGGGASGQWNRPDRGPFRWSYYRVWRFDDWASPRNTRTDWPEMRIEEMNLLKAEALYRTGNPGGAATLINLTRTEHGLNATDAAGTNTSCVPKLPNGNCGDLLEMLKWEVRMETMYSGLHLGPWYFHGRGWGDLAEGTPLQFPVPGREMELLLQTPYTFGGANPSAATAGTYGF